MQLALQELGHVLKETNMVGEAKAAVLEGGEEEEEDTQIQSSLPFYFEHVFGRKVGFSQAEDAETPGTIPCGVCSDSQVTSVMESQPFVGATVSGMIWCRFFFRNESLKHHHLTLGPLFLFVPSAQQPSGTQDHEVWF